MKFAHITPISLLDRVLSPLDDFHLVVLNVAERSPEYVEFYRDRIASGNYVILDSAAFEGDVATPERMVKAALIVQPSEVVLPDVLESGEETLRLSIQTASRLDRCGFPGNFMAVPHGSSLSDYFRNATELSANLLAAFPGHQVTLGIQEEIPELFGMSRLELCRRLAHQLDSVAETGPVSQVRFHLLGVSEQLEEGSFEARQNPRIRSCDTAKFVIWGLDGIHVTPRHRDHPPEYPGRKKFGGRLGYFDYDTKSRVRTHLVKENIAAWRM